jgi:hypothetical protein
MASTSLEDEVTQISSAERSSLSATGRISWGSEWVRRISITTS